VLIYELLTGNLPTDSLRSSSSVGLSLEPDVPQSIQQLIQNCINEDPAKRPSNLSEMISIIVEPRSARVDLVTSSDRQQFEVREIGRLKSINHTSRSSSVINRFLYVPPNAKYSWDTEGIYGLPKGGSFIPCRVFTNPNAQWFIVYAHGNKYDIGFSGIKEFAAGIPANIIAFEYKGYGIYPGVPTAHDHIDDCLTAYNFVADKIGWPLHRIIMMGHSIGNGPICEVMKHIALASPSRFYHAPIILCSAFTSTADLVSSRLLGLPVGSLTHNPFNILKALEFCKGPVLLIHGAKDDLVPISQFRRLIDCCNQNDIFFKAYEYPESGHTIHFQNILRCILKWLDYFAFTGEPLEQQQEQFASVNLSPLIPGKELKEANDPITVTLSQAGVRVEFLAKEIASALTAIPQWLKSHNLDLPRPAHVWKCAFTYLNPLPNIFRYIWIWVSVF